MYVKCVCELMCTCWLPNKCSRAVAPLRSRGVDALALSQDEGWFVCGLQVGKNDCVFGRRRTEQLWCIE